MMTDDCFDEQDDCNGDDDQIVTTLWLDYDRIRRHFVAQAAS